MWKVIKKQLEKVTLDKKKFSLWMKWEFSIEFANDSFGPYEYKFAREDCYFSDWLNDRGSVLFPLKNKRFDNTEIFLERDDIVITTGERGSLTWKSKNFIDVINLETEKKYRVVSDEVNLIYNDKENIVINFFDKGKWETLTLNALTLEVISHDKETLYAFFKCVFNVEKNNWKVLDFTPASEVETDIEKKYKSWYYNLWKVSITWVPKAFDRKKFLVSTDKKDIDVWENSIK